MSIVSSQSSITKSSPGRPKHSTRGRLLCLECRRRKKQCLYDSLEEDCKYCVRKRTFCGKKLSKSEYLNKNGPVNPEMHSIQASIFIEFWMKVMKTHYPGASEEELLDVFKKSIEQKEEQIKLRRGKPMVDEEDDDSTAGEPMRDGSVDTTPADTPPLAKKTLFSFANHTQLPLTTCASVLISASQDSVRAAPAELIPIPQAFSGPSPTNVCSTQPAELYLKFEQAPSLGFPSINHETNHFLNHEADHTFVHEANHSLDHEDHSFDHEANRSDDHEPSHSFDHGTNQSLDHEADHSHDQIMEEDGDYWWI